MKKHFLTKIEQAVWVQQRPRAHPRASLWDNGADPVAELVNATAVRQLALAELNTGRLNAGLPRDRIEAVLLPTFLHWRFQLDAAAKLIGGVDYRHAVVGDGQPSAAVVPAERQRAALAAILALVGPGHLTLPARFDDLVPAPGEPRAAERFARTAGSGLDVVDVAMAGAGLVLDALLEPTRLARLATQEVEPTLREVLAELRRAVFEAPTPELEREARVLRALQAAVVERAIDAAVDSGTRADVRAALVAMLRDVLTRCRSAAFGGSDGIWDAHRDLLQRRIAHALDRRLGGLERGLPRRETPPGSPIGTGR